MKYIVYLLTILLLFCSCKPTINDKDAIKVGVFTWMLHDLNTIVFQNGDTLQCADDSTLWRQLCDAHIPAYCHVSTQSDSIGLLYNYWAMKDERNIAPKGWHVAKQEEWAYIINIDTMNLQMVNKIYEQNKMNIKKYSTRVLFESLINGNVHSWEQDFIDGTTYWGWSRHLCVEICINDFHFDGYENEKDESCIIYQTASNWEFKKYDECIRNYDEYVNIYATCPYYGRFIRCVKDY